MSRSSRTMVWLRLKNLQTTAHSITYLRTTKENPLLSLNVARQPRSKLLLVVHQRQYRFLLALALKLFKRWISRWGELRQRQLHLPQQVLHSRAQLLSAQILLFFQQVHNLGHLSLSDFCMVYALDTRILSCFTENGYVTLNQLSYTTVRDLKEMEFKRGDIAAIQCAIARWLQDSHGDWWVSLRFFAFHICCTLLPIILIHCTLVRLHRTHVQMLLLLYNFRTLNHQLYF